MILMLPPIALLVPGELNVRQISALAVLIGKSCYKDRVLTRETFNFILGKGSIIHKRIVKFLEGSNKFLTQQPAPPTIRFEPTEVTSRGERLDTGQA
jgi:hypothetical protein